MGRALAAPVSLAVEPYDRFLLSHNLGRVLYEFATCEYLNLQTGSDVSDQLVRLRHYAPFVPAQSLPAGRPWRPLLEDVANEVEERFIDTLQVGGEVFAQISYPEPDESFSLYALHAIDWPHGVELVVNWRTMDVWRELPYHVYVWSLWHQYVSMKAGLEPWRVRHEISLPYVNGGDLGRLAGLTEMRSHSGPILKEDVSWPLFLECERHLRMYGNDDMGELPLSWQLLGEMLRYRIHRDVEKVGPVWRPVV